MNDNPKEKKSSPWRWVAGILTLAAVVMEAVEPLLFEGEKYDTWRLAKIAAGIVVATVIVIALRKSRP